VKTYERNALIFDSGLTTSEVIVLLAIGRYANDAGQCWPSVNRIAQNTKMNERSVRRILKRLEGRGLSITARHGRVALLQIIIGDLPKEDNPGPSVSDSGPSVTPDLECTTPDIEATTPDPECTNPGPRDRRTIKEPSIELFKEPSIVADATSAPAKQDPVTAQLNQVLDEWFLLWRDRKDAGKKAGAPRSQQMTKACRGAITKVLKGKHKQTPEDLCLIARWAFQSPEFSAQHLRGDKEGGTENEYLFPVNIYRTTKLADKLSKARRWSDAGEKVDMGQDMSIREMNDRIRSGRGFGGNQRVVRDITPADPNEMQLPAIQEPNLYDDTYPF